MTAELTTRPDRSPMALIEAAIEKGLLPDQLGKLMDLQERWERNRAAERFADALTAFQRECPQIEKKKPGSSTKDQNGNSKGPAYFYAPYEEVMAVAGPIMVRHNIVATFTTQHTDKGLCVTCRIRVGIHAEETTLEIARPLGNKMTSDPQLDGINLSYAKRYSLCAALNIVCRDEDRDGDQVMATLSDPQIAELVPMVESLSEAGALDMAKFLEWSGSDKVQTMHPSKFADALRMAKSKLAKSEAARTILATKMKAGEP